MQDVFWPGIAAMAAMYVVVFAVGVLASRGRSRGADEGSLTELMLAGRSLPLWVGLMTMTATWVGGGYINGTAEYSFSYGGTWGLQGGLGYALSLVIGGLFYAGVMRRHGFATLIDPLESRYGGGTAALLMVPAVLAEIFWSAAILVALGGTFGTIMGLDLHLSILLSAAVAVGYTVFGGLRAVAYTDVVQLVFIALGLGIAVPFAVSAAGGLSAVFADAPGGPGVEVLFPSFVSATEGLAWSDVLLVYVLGGIPWNVYFQRVLSSRDAPTARNLSLVAAGLCALFAVPPFLIGAAARHIDWATLAGPEAVDLLAAQPTLVLPYMLRYAVPTSVAVVGLGAVSAAVMSSVDSSILSASSLVAWNGYKRLLRPQATAVEVARLVRVLVVLIGGTATLIAFTVGSVGALWFLCGDIVYCVLFPQLTLALFDPRANRSGALAGLAASVVMRLSAGVTDLGLPAFLPWPVWEGGEFPFRTTAMLAGFAVALLVSRSTQVFDPPRALRKLDAP